MRRIKHAREKKKRGMAWRSISKASERKKKHRHGGKRKRKKKKKADSIKRHDYRRKIAAAA